MDIEICDKMETITVGVNINDTKTMESNGLTVLEDGKTTIKCHRCDYTSDKVTNCRRHFETMHTLLRVPELCCGISFPTKGEYRDHRKVAHPGGLYFCHLCPAEPVKRKALLVRHMSIHTGIKQHTCKLCGYASPNKFNVKRHMVTHSVTSTNIKHKEPKIEKSSENQNVSNNCSPNIVSPVSTSSLVLNHCLVLPDSTTDSLSSIKQNPILRGILNSQEDNFPLNNVNEEEKRKKSISHSINNILSRDVRPRGQSAGSSSSAISSYHEEVEPRFPGNKEEGLGEIDNKMTSENWSGIDESCTKGYCYNWSHVSAPGSSFTPNLHAYPYELPLYNGNYDYNCLPTPRIHTYNNSTPFPFFPDCSFSDIDSARFLQHETNFLSPYDSRGFAMLNSTTTENTTPNTQYYFCKQKTLKSGENFKVCHQDNPQSQAALIKQQDSRFVPAMGVWSFKDSSSASCLLPTYHYSTLSKDSCYTDSQGVALESRPPVTFTNTGDCGDIYTEETTNPISTDISQHSNQDKISPQDSKFKKENPSNASKHDYSKTETEHSLLEYIPKKLRLSKKFLTNCNCSKT